MPTVALIDDDPASEILVSALRCRGLTVTRFRSTSEVVTALESIASSDVIILDLIMDQPLDQTSTFQTDGSHAGIGLLQAIRRRNTAVPVIVFSASMDSALVDALSDMPNTRFVPKWSSPSIKEFLTIVEKALGTSIGDAAPQCFIVHGHDDSSKLALKNYLQNTLHLREPIVLHEQPNLGRTIIEKFETYASMSDYAFILLTPDDPMANAASANDSKRRARQNVIFEMGYFLGALGRTSGRVFLLHKGPLELPSDLSGIVYIDIAAGIEKAGELIRKELNNVR